jgi:hypothetical protein
MSEVPINLVSKMRQLAFLLLALSLVATQTVVFADTRVAVHVSNQSGGPIAVNWVNPANRETVHMYNLMSGVENRLDSFFGHEFEILELPNKSGECGSDADTSCKNRNFKVTERSKQCKCIHSFHIVL